MPLTVALDTTSFAGPRTGVAVFVEHVLEGLSGRDGVRVERYRISRRRGPEGERWIPFPGRLATRMWSHANVPSASRWLRDVDVVHATNYLAPPSGRPTVITIHDCTPFTHPDWVPGPVRGMVPVIRRAVEHGAWVHTPTEYVAVQVRALLGTDRVVAVAHGGPDLEPPGAPLPASVPAGRPYVVAVGTIEHRKNLSRLVQAFGLVHRAHPELALVVAGPDGNGRAALDTAIRELPPAAGGSVVVTGWLDAPARAALVRGAQLLAYPSLEEGFGLPVLEAMAAGVPVVTSTAGAVMEVGGGAALTVDALDVQGLADALARAAFDEPTRQRLIAAGRARAACFDWERTVEGLLDLYRRAVAA